MNRKKVFIIAEAGVNHNGKVQLAKKLIDVAKKSGADAIKFQTFKANKISTKKAPKAKYQILLNNKNEKQFELLKKLELSFQDFKILKQYSEKKRIEFLSSPFDEDSLNYLKLLKVKKIKIPSGEINNIPLLRKIGKSNLQTIMSTGMSTNKEIHLAIKTLQKSGLYKKKLTLLHCTTSYPTIYKDVNLNAMLSIKKRFKIDIGYSDHTLGADVALAAVAMGATVIEKHITLNKKMSGPDHKASMEPKEFKEMVNSIRNIEKSLGSKNKILTKNELQNIKVIRKSIFASENIMKGQLLTENNMCIKRPALGHPPTHWDKFLNSRAKKNFKIDDPIK